MASDQPITSPMPSGQSLDLEKGQSLARSLTNSSLTSFSWADVEVTVKDHKTKQPLQILSPSHGSIQAGTLLGLMGPSGSGKTTLLNVLAHRTSTMHGKIQGKIMLNGQVANEAAIQQVSTFVEQEDAMIGILTVRETVDFAARLSVKTKLAKDARSAKVTDLIESFGLQRQADTIVGTPLRKGLSGGQKRRLSVASQLVTSPQLVFLDEPTSGLDSAASYEVVKYIRQVAKQHNLIVIASIHQPSTTTFQLFDQLLLLSGGRTCYFGPVPDIQHYFENIGHPVPAYINPAEFLLDLVNNDFSRNEKASQDTVNHVQGAWASSVQCRDMVATATAMADSAAYQIEHQSQKQNLTVAWVLLHRNFIKSYRDFIAYGTRVVMYFGLAIMMGTVWLRLSYHQSSIQPFINAIFFGGAFMSFMAVAYVPSIIEDLQNFNKERANGLYGPLPFVIANSLVSIPWLFIIALMFSIITYWLGNFYATAGGFWMWTLWLFLDLLAAEGLVVLVSSLFPIFVVSLAVTAFANGLWMCVNGFLVPMGTLNPFWKCKYFLHPIGLGYVTDSCSSDVFHYIDYQAYVFQGMLVNQFRSTIWDCAKSSKTGEYQCMYPSDLQAEGKIRGTAVLEAFKYSWSDGVIGKWIGLMFAIILVYRVLGYVVLVLKKH
jgi:ABC-type multidrug transport system ATPase subunit